MELDYWRDFIVVSETLNFSEAANQLHLSQSALSKRIRVLEENCGGKLFERTTRRIELSERGRAILPSAMQLVADASRLERDLSRYDAKHSNRLTLGTIRNFQSFGIDRIFLGFEQEYPQYTLNLLEGELSELERDFREHKTNLFCTYHSGECYGSGGDPDFHFISCGNGEFGIITRAGDPLAADGPVPVRDLEGCQLLLPTRGMIFYNRILELLEKAGVNVNIVFEGGTSGCLDLVRAGAGVAIQHYELYKSYRYRSELEWKLMVPTISYDYGLGYRETSVLSRPERAFISYLKEKYPLQN